MTEIQRAERVDNSKAQTKYSNSVPEHLGVSFHAFLVLSILNTPSRMNFGW